MNSTDTTNDKGLRIVSLQAENIKRLKAVDITPDGDTVVISGRNGQGKTSVLDSIWFALAGTAAQKGTPQPIREGEKKASVTLDLGDFTVTRRWSDTKTDLTVLSKDGAKYGSPQKFLDEKLGALSFDPLAFAQMAPKEQLASLLELVDLPFVPAELESERRSIFDERTEVNRRVTMLEGQLAGIERPHGEPREPVSTSDILSEFREAQRVQDERLNATRKVVACRNTIQRLQNELDAEESVLRDWDDMVKNLPETPDLDEINDRLNSVEQVNAEIRAEAENSDRWTALTDASAKSYNLTENLRTITEAKEQALAAAEMPVEGLGFDDEGVTFNGIPFRQCSGAERLRVSLGMAMSANPTIRVIRITDGSLLDDQNLALVQEMASDRGYQVWIERVGTDESIGFVIEDGMVQS